MFVHPQLPRIQLSAKTTSISIIPTILDLLVQTNSLDSHSNDVTGQLMHQYQGQSLIRTFVSSKDGGRQPWYFGVINPGGSMMAVSSAATTFRLILPLCSTAALRFTDVASDPAEESPIVEWTMAQMEKRVRQLHGDEAASWLRDAERLGRWWFWEQRRRWQYFDKAARSTDRSPQGGTGGGTKKDHWWET